MTFQSTSSAISRRRVLAAAVATACGSLNGLAQARDGIVNIVVPFTAGSGADAMARFIAAKLKESANTTVVVENKTGASGNIGNQFVASAQPDGRTLLLTANTLVMSTAMFDNIKYDPVKSFTPISKIAVGKLVLVVNQALPINNLDDFRKAAKNPAIKLDYASPGKGTPQHLAMELLQNQLGISLTHIPYTGQSQAVTDLVGGHVGAMFLGIHIAVPLMKSGKIKIIGVGSPTRSTIAPDVPTLDQQGTKNFNADVWFGMFAPSKVPADEVATLRADVGKIVESPEMREFLGKQGLEPAGITIAAFDTQLREENASWSNFIRSNKLRAE